MEISRRGLLKASAVGSVGIAGCASQGGGEATPSDPPTPTETKTPTPTPQPTLYEEGDKDEMLLEAGDFPDGWKQRDSGELDAVFLSENETRAILLAVGIFESVEEAEEEFDLEKQGFNDPNEYPIGDEAFWAERSDNARTYFRHLNALGLVWGSRESTMGDVVPDPDGSQHYAQEMYEKWEAIDTSR